MLYVNTKKLDMEHKLVLERAILMWRTQWEMWTIKVLEKYWNLANTFWQILKWRMEDAESSTLPCLPSTFLCSTINWIMYSKNWNVLQKLTLHLDSFWKTLMMDCVNTFTLTRTILFWKELNLSLHKLLWLTWKTECRKRILLIFVLEKEPKQKRKFYKFTNITIFASLLKDIPLDCKDTVLPEPFLRNCNVNCLTFERNTRQP